METLHRPGRKLFNFLLGNKILHFAAHSIQKRLHVPALTLHEQLDAAVCAITHGPDYRQAVGQALSSEAEAHALDTARVNDSLGDDHG